EQSARVAHGVLPMNAGPVGERGACDDDRSEQFRTDGGDYHDRPASLAVADHARLAVGVRMQRDHPFEKTRFRARNVGDGLPRHRLRQEAYEVAGVAGLEDDADFAVGLEAANARAVAGARIDHHEWPARRIDLDAGRRNDAREAIIDGPFERTAVDNQLDVV